MGPRNFARSRNVECRDDDRKSTKKCAAVPIFVLSLHVDDFASHAVPILIENDRERYKSKGKESKQGIAPSIAQRFIHSRPCQWQKRAEDET